MRSKRRAVLVLKVGSRRALRVTVRRMFRLIDAGVPLPKVLGASLAKSWKFNRNTGSRRESAGGEQT
jgi:hypothetical protein